MSGKSSLLIHMTNPRWLSGWRTDWAATSRCRPRRDRRCWPAIKGPRGDAHSPQPSARSSRVSRRFTDGKVAGSSGDLSVDRRQLGESDSTAIQQLLAQSRFDPSRVLAIGAIGSLAWHMRTPTAERPVRLNRTAVHRRGAHGPDRVQRFSRARYRGGWTGHANHGTGRRVLFRDPKESRWLVRSGGVTSLVYLPAGGRPQDVMAFEVGPGTRLLDTIIREGSGGKERFDQGGKHAVQGFLSRCANGEMADASILGTAAPQELAAIGIRSGMDHAVGQRRGGGGRHVGRFSLYDLPFPGQMRLACQTLGSRRTVPNPKPCGSAGAAPATDCSGDCSNTNGRASHFAELMNWECQFRRGKRPERRYWPPWQWMGPGEQPGDHGRDWHWED